MDGKEFIELLSDPQKLDDYPVEQLHRLAQDYPYSQPVQLLYAIRLSSSSEYLFNRQLGKTSILTDDRSVLFDLFERPSEVRSPKQEKEAGLAAEEARAKSSAEAIINTEEKEDQPSLKKVEDKPLAEAKIKEEAEAPVERAPDSPSPAHPPQNLSPQERVQAILAENRRLRAEHDKGTPRKEESDFDRRVAEIKEKLAKLKGDNALTEAAPLSEEIDEAVPLKEQPLVAEEEKSPDSASADKSTEQKSASASVENEKEPESAKVTEVSATMPPPEGDEAGLDEEALLAAHEEQEEESPLVDQADPDREEAEASFNLGEGVVFSIDSGEKSAEASVTKEATAEEEPGSFFDWLHKVDSGQVPVQAAPAKNTTDSADTGESFREKMQLLDSFVERLPELKRKKPGSIKAPGGGVQVGKITEQEDDSLVTETLAKVYLKQQHYQRAIKAYEILKLKYPEKSALFADQISEIKKLINSK